MTFRKSFHNLLNLDLHALQMFPSDIAILKKYYVESEGELLARIKKELSNA